MRTLIFLFCALVSLYASTPELVIPERPSGAIRAITIGNTEDWFATLSVPNNSPSAAVQIWSLPDAQLLRTIAVNQAQTIAASPNQKVIASGASFRLDLIDATSGSVRMLALRLPDQANVMTWSPDGKFILAGWRKLLKIDPATGQAETVASMPEGYNMIKMQFLGGGQRLMVSLEATFGTKNPALVLILEAQNWREAARFESRDAHIVVAVDPGQKTLAAASGDGDLRFWSLDNYRPVGKPIAFPFGPIDPSYGRLFKPNVSSLIFSADGKHLGAYSNPARLQVIEVATGTVQSVNTDNARLLSFGVLAPLYSKDLIIGGGLYGDLTVMDGQIVNARKSVIAWNGTKIVGARFDSNGLEIVAAERNGMAFANRSAVWSVNEAPRSLSGKDDHPIALVRRPDGELSLAINDPLGLLFRNIRTGAEEKADKAYRSALMIGDDGQWAALAPAAKDSVRLLNTVTRQEVTVPVRGKDRLLALSPTGNAIAIAPGLLEDYPVRILSLPDQREIASFTPKFELPSQPNRPNYPGDNGVSSFTFSADGKHLGLIYYDGRTRVWDASKGTLELTLETAQGSNLLAFSADGKRLAIAGREKGVEVWSLDEHSHPLIKFTTKNPADFLHFREDGRQLLVGTTDSVLSLFDLQSEKKLGSFLLQSVTGPWIAFTDDGFFDGSEEAAAQLGWRFSNDTFDRKSAGSYFADFFYPGIVRRMLEDKLPAPEANLETLERTTGTLTFKPLKPLGANARSIDVELAVEPNKAGMQNVRLFRNGSLVRRWDGDVSGVVHASVQLQAGHNTFTAYGFNRAKVRTDWAAVSVEGGAALKRRGALHILAIGINEYKNGPTKLKYALNDARYFAATLAGAREEIVTDEPQLNKGPFPKNLFASSGPADVQVLPEADATKSAILKAIRQLAAKALPEDSFILFFAGHGTALGKGYYLLPVDFPLGQTSPTKASLDQAAVSDQDLEEALVNLNVSTSALIVDACESGQAAQAADDWRRGPIDSHGLAQMAYEKGMYLLAASQSNQSAQELQRLQHGLLTWALIGEGLREGKAFENPARSVSDAGLSFDDWLNWSAERVPLLQAETASVKRGVLLPKSNLLAVASQRPTLLAHRIPGAEPLIVALTNVELDPITMTVRATRSPVKKAGEKPNWSTFVIPATDKTTEKVFGQFLQISRQGVTIAGIGFPTNSASVPSSGHVFSVSFGKDGMTKHLLDGVRGSAAAFGNKGIIVVGKTTAAYDPISLTPLADLPSEIEAGQVSPDGSSVAWCSPSNTGNKQSNLFVSALPNIKPLQIPESDGTCRFQWITLSGRQAVALGGAEITLRTVDGEIKQIVNVAGTPLAVNASGDQIAIMAASPQRPLDGGPTYLFELSDGSKIRKLPEEVLGNWIFPFVFSPDGQRIASVDDSGGVWLTWLTDTDNVVTQLEPLGGRVKDLRFSPDGGLLGALQEDGHCQLYDVKSGKLLLKLSPVGDARSWFIETPDRRFDADKAIWDKVLVHAGTSDKPLRESQTGYTPGILVDVLAQE